MARIKTFVNGSAVLPADLNSIQDDYEPAFSSWKQAVPLHGGALWGSAAANEYPLLNGHRQCANAMSVEGVGGFYLDLSATGEYNPTSPAVTRALKLRIRAVLTTNAAAPTTGTLTVALKPITAVGGGSGITLYTLGAAVTTLVFTNPAANAMLTSTSADLTPPAAGHYLYTFTNSLAIAAAGMASVSVQTLYKAV